MEAAARAIKSALAWYRNLLGTIFKEEEPSAKDVQQLTKDIQLTTNWLDTNNEQWYPSSESRKELLRAAKELVRALEPPDTALWRIILSVRKTGSKDILDLIAF
jgi:type II secretory pathway pseudopilin PulG